MNLLYGQAEACVLSFVDSATCCNVDVDLWELLRTKETRDF